MGAKKRAADLLWGRLGVLLARPPSLKKIYKLGLANLLGNSCTDELMLAQTQPHSVRLRLRIEGNSGMYAMRIDK